MLPLLSINNFSEHFAQIEFLVIFNTIIFGFVVSEFFVGWGIILRKRRNKAYYWEYLTWTILTFLLVIDWWWASWHRIKYINSSILYFFYSLFIILIFYFITVFLFPRDLNINKVNIESYFKKNIRWVFSLYSLLFVTMIFNSYIYHEHGLFVFQNYLRAAACILTLTVVVYNSSRLRHAILAFCWILYIGYILKVEFALF